jgi:hypothetical protein
VPRYPYAGGDLPDEGEPVLLKTDRHCSEHTSPSEPGARGSSPETNSVPLQHY